ncbi:MAG: type I restriction-modification system subunit M N-terminal domain-containing protein [Spirochaetia bacterium]|nr:type I restriction-modification system subunit M N-terminal domain-containing protein [Spirochaetia bacterium]
MAKSKKIVKQKSIEETLWDSADKLRGSVEPAEYKHVVLGLIFLKFAGDKFEERRNELIAEGKQKYVEMKDFYNMNNVFYLEETSRWSYIEKNAKQNDISLKIDTALHDIEKDNPSLKGALPDNYFSRLGLDKTKLATLVDTINKINTLEDIELNDIERNYRTRKDEIIFMDLRQIGEPFEKKFTQFNTQHIQDIARTFHSWQQKDNDYKNIPEYCYSANKEEVAKKDYSLVPSKYIEFINRDENIDFDSKMKTLQTEFENLLKEEEQSKKDLLLVFKELGYEIQI